MNIGLSFRSALIMVMLSLIVTGCAIKGKHEYATEESVKSFAGNWIGREAEKLIIHYPDAKVQELGKGMFRYVLEFETESTWKETMRYTGTGIGGNLGAYSWFEVYFFVKEGVIQSYQMKRFSEQRQIHLF